MNEFNETMRRILVSMELEELNLGEAASEVMSLDFAEWQQRAEGIYDLIQFENGVDIGGKYPLEKLEILEQKICKPVVHAGRVFIRRKRRQVLPVPARCF